jgi:hypothetical protein
MAAGDLHSAFEAVSWPAIVGFYSIQKKENNSQ